MTKTIYLEAYSDKEIQKWSKNEVGMQTFEATKLRFVAISSFKKIGEILHALSNNAQVQRERERERETYIECKSV